MQRNRSRVSVANQWLFAVAVATSLLSGPVVVGQTSGNAAGTTSVVPANARAQMWAATARFVYTDDPTLMPIQAELLQTINDKSLPAFNSSVDKAVALEKKKLPGQQRVLKFRGVVDVIQDKVTPSDYGGLAQAIVAELQKNPDRMADLERKSSLAALSSQLNRLATGTATTAAEAANTAPSLTDVTGAEATAVQDSGTDPYAVPKEQLEPEAQTDITTSAPAMPVPATSPLLWAALLMSGLSLLGVLYLLLTRSKSGGRPRSSSQSSSYDSDLSGTSTQRQSSSQDSRLSNAQLMEVREVVYKALTETRSPSAPTTPAPKAKQAPKPPTRPTPPQAVAPTPVAPPQPVAYADPEPTDHLFAVEAPAAPVPVEPAAPRVHIIYANQQPIHGAFLRDNLADAPASYTIFEIMVDERTPDQGTFVVTRNESGHGGYIGSHMSILEPACTYNYPTGPVSRIITETPGTVQRTPSGDWRINQKARIYFA